MDFETERQTYYDRLCELVQNVADLLVALAARAPEKRGVIDTAARVVDADAPRVVLAEVTDDLVHQREDVRSYLEQLGFVVLPRRRYSRDDLALHRTQLRAVEVDDLAAHPCDDGVDNGENGDISIPVRIS